MIRFLLIFLFCFPAFADLNPSEFKGEELYDGRVMVASREPLSKYHLDIINRVVEITDDLYGSYLDNLGYELKDTNEQITIVILTLEEINDHSNFPGYVLPKAPTAARYLPIEKIIVISLEALRSNPEYLAHELAHFHNAASGIVKKAKDEEIAYKYEDFFLSNE